MDFAQVWAMAQPTGKKKTSNRSSSKANKRNASVAKKERATSSRSDFVAKLQRLAELNGGVIEAATDDQWARLERMLGLKLPVAYKRLLKVFGTGAFGGRTLLLNPSAERDWRSEFSARWAHGVSGLLSGAFPKLSFYPEKHGLLPFGMTIESDYLCFDRREANPNAWTVTVCSLHKRIVRKTKFSAPEFLYRLFENHGSQAALPKVLIAELKEDGPVFQPQPYLFS